MPSRLLVTDSDIASSEIKRKMGEGNVSRVETTEDENAIRRWDARYSPAYGSFWKEVVMPKSVYRPFESVNWSFLGLWGGWFGTSIRGAVTNPPSCSYCTLRPWKDPDRFRVTHGSHVGSSAFSAHWLARHGYSRCCFACPRVGQGNGVTSLPPAPG